MRGIYPQVWTSRHLLFRGHIISTLKEKGRLYDSNIPSYITICMDEYAHKELFPTISVSMEWTY